MWTFKVVEIVRAPVVRLWVCLRGFWGWGIFLGAVEVVTGDAFGCFGDIVI